MTVITITTQAKCKDCAYLGSGLDGKRKIHACDNKKSEKYLTVVTLKTLVCDKWKLVREEESK